MNAKITAHFRVLFSLVLMLAAPLAALADELDSWVLRRSQAAGELKGVAVGNGRLTVVGRVPVGFQNYGGLNSADGVSWTLNQQMWETLAVTYGNGQFVATGKQGDVFTSADGRTWTYQGWSTM